MRKREQMHLCEKVCHILKKALIIISIVQMILLTACNGNDIIIIDNDYKDYINSFFNNSEFRPFELSKDLDVRTSIIMAHLVKETGGQLSKTQKTKLFSAFREQQIRDSYIQSNIYMNENLETWKDYLDYLIEADKSEYKYIKNQAKLMMKQILNNWDGYILEFNIEDDSLTRLNILTSFFKINLIVNDDNIKNQINSQANKEFTQYKKEKVGMDSELIIPYLYYFKELNMGLSLPSKDVATLKTTITNIMKNIEIDNYESYYFYLPFLYTVKEYYEPGSYSKEYYDFNITAINKLIETNNIDWNSLYIAMQYTRDIIPQKTINKIFEILNINQETDIFQKQIVYLTESYANIYYYIYLSDINDISLADSKIKTLEELLRRNRKNSNSVKEYYYNLKLSELGIFENDCFISQETIRDEIQIKLEENTFNYHDAGSVYYLMLINVDFKLFNNSIIKEIIDKQTEIICGENIDGSINTTLKQLYKISRENTNINYINLLEDDYSFNENIYFIAHFNKSIDKSCEDVIINAINNRKVEFGYSKNENDGNLDFETTYRIIYAVNHIKIK